MQGEPEVLCAGIVVADHVCTPISHLPAAGELVMTDRILLTIGGCAANVAVDLSKMGVSAGVVGRVGGDLCGRIVADLLREEKVDVSNLTISPDADTSQTLIVNVIGQDRRFIHTFGANGEFSAVDIPLEQVMRAKVLYLGGYLLMQRVDAAAMAAVFAAAQRAGVKTVLDVAIPRPGDYLPQLKQLLPHVDVFTPNNDEAEVITGEKDPRKQAERFHQLGARTAIVSLGGRGAVLVSDSERLEASAFDVPFVDGSGGGDAFDAGYICGLLHGMDTEDCLRMASALGASCVRAVGTTTGVFSLAECEAFLLENSLRIQRR